MDDFIIPKEVLAKLKNGGDLEDLMGKLFKQAVQEMLKELPQLML